MSRLWWIPLAVGCASSQAVPPTTGAIVGAAAPAFTLPDLSGTDRSLADLTGTITVLEWFNPGCPYVVYAHGEGPLKDQATRATEAGVQWIAINSGAPGKQGHGAEANRTAKAQWGMGHSVLLDEDGAIGRAYGAVTTPHMFVLDAEGEVVYRGALDNQPMGRGDGTYKNFVDLALGDLAAGREVQINDTKPYGCSVKYQR